MRVFLKLIYNCLALPLLFIYSKLIALTNDKVKHRAEFANSYLDIPPKKNKRIMIHASSMGEFEQVKYLVEIIRKSEPESEVIISFFSPSGYIHLKDRMYYDYKVYVPLDFKNRVRNFVKHIDPDIVLIVRYDLWYNFIRSLHKNNIPIHLINATYTISKSLGKKFLGVKFYRLLLSRLTSIYCVNEYHKGKFNELKLKIPIQIVPDTRYDRIISKVSEAKQNNLLRIAADKRVIVIGSSWKMDEQIVSEVALKLKKKYNLIAIYVPHEVDEKIINNLKTKVVGHYLYSEFNRSNYLDKDLIVDEIGILLELYKYADIAYVGGAFGNGVHSVTEPAGYGVPIFCGNQHYKNSDDARKLVASGGLVPINNSKELYTKISYFLDNEIERIKLGAQNIEYVNSLSGSSQIVYNNLIKPY